MKVRTIKRRLIRRRCKMIRFLHGDYRPTLIGALRYQAEMDQWVKQGAFRKPSAKDWK